MILCPFQLYYSHTRIMKCCVHSGMVPVMVKKIQSAGLKPGTASPAGQPVSY